MDQLKKVSKKIKEQTSGKQTKTKTNNFSKVNFWLLVYCNAIDFVAVMIRGNGKKSRKKHNKKTKKSTVIQHKMKAYFFYKATLNRENIVKNLELTQTKK